MALWRRIKFMAEIIFNCPACKQPVQGDDAWAGQEIECPICKAPMVVPQAGASSARTETKRSLGKQLVDVPAETRLSAGSTQVPRSGGNLPIQPRFQKKQVKRQSPVARYAVVGVVAIALVASGWFAWPYLRPYIPFFKADESAAAAQAAQTNAQETTPPPPKEPPMTAPVYNLDIAQAKISEGKVNGTIAGTNFVPDLVRLDKVAGVHVLTLRAGPGQSPDRGLRVYLRLKPNESPTGQTWTVSEDARSPIISRVVKVWKTNPRYAAKETPFTTGFALKLELGRLTDSNTIPGKIYAALPDAEHTVVAGAFNALTAASSGQAAPAAPPQAVPSTQTEAQKAEFQKRYGVRP
jgi:hypothetical protein